jgi:hypothetical protein
MTMSLSVIRRRCDEPMRKSKERCYTNKGHRWRCTGECRTCICCLEMMPDGRERHFNPLFKGVRIDEFKEEGK